MFHLKNKDIRDLYQWNTNISLVFEDGTLAGTEVHFSNDKKTSISKTIDDNLEVTVPDILFQKSLPIEVYLFIKDRDERYTKIRKFLKVLSRPKPADYIISEEEIKIWDTKLDKYFSPANAGKVLTINEYGEAIPMSTSAVMVPLSFNQIDNIIKEASLSESIFG